MVKKKNNLEVKKAVIMAGGFGTRFLPATIALAKELFPIGNKPILLYHLEDLLKAGITEVLVIGNTFKEESFKKFLNPSKDYLDKIEAFGGNRYMKEYFDIFSKMKITYANQDANTIDYNPVVKKNYVAGKHGSSIAVYVAKEWTNGEPFIVLNGDDICIYEDGKSISKEVIDAYKATGDMIIYGKEMPRNLIFKYSSMEIGDTMDSVSGAIKITNIVEKPETGTEPSNIMGFARYLFTKEIFGKIEKSTPRKNGEFCITDVIQTLAKENKFSTVIFDGNYFDCGSMSGYVLANDYFAIKDSTVKEQIFEGLEKMTSDEMSKITKESEKEKTF